MFGTSATARIACPGAAHTTKALRAGNCMRAFGLAAAAAIISTMAAAADGRFERSLKMLAPAERLEQLCDYTAMARIREKYKDYRPNRAVANAMAEPVASADTL